MRRIPEILRLFVVLVGIFSMLIKVPPSAMAQSGLTVKTTQDPITCPSPPGDQDPLSFRCAIQQANDSGGGTVQFDIPVNDRNCNVITEVCTIPLFQALPPLLNGVVINGYTQPGAVPNFSLLSAGDTAQIKIQIDGNSLPPNRALIIEGNHDIIKGLSITNFHSNTNQGTGTGIIVCCGNPHDDMIQGNFIGVEPDGTPAGNGNFGVWLQDDGLPNTSYNIILGGTDPASANVISDNGIGSVSHDNGGVAVSVGTGITIQGNYIGTDPTGKMKTANSNGVVLIGGSHNDTIGGSINGGGGNVISGNNKDGIMNLGDQNLITGNLIGTDASGTVALANANGIEINGNTNTIGGEDSSLRNIISGTTSDGVLITGGSGNALEGNFIGTDISGTLALSNGTGVVAVGTGVPNNNNVIGGKNTSDRNVISSNLLNGVELDFVKSTMIINNYIGTDVTGMQQLGNGNNGVYLHDGATGDSVSQNTIAYNKQSGVLVGSPSGDSISTHVAISQNVIMANGDLGITLAGQAANSCSIGSIHGLPNDYTPCPTVQVATTSKVSGTACPGCIVEVYEASNESDDQKHGEGQFFHGMATTNSAGVWSLQASLSTNVFVTATATTPGPLTPETSEFAANVRIPNTFSALDNNDNNALGLPPSSIGQPDGALAVGPRLEVVAANAALAMYDRSGTRTGSAQSFYTFFGTTFKDGVSTTFDPRSLYDPGNADAMGYGGGHGRFVVLTVSRNLESKTGTYNLAISRTENPQSLTSADWCTYNISSVRPGLNGSDPTWADFPGLGMDGDNIYITSNQFLFNPLTGQGDIQYARIVVIPKISVYPDAAATSGCPTPTETDFGDTNADRLQDLTGHLVFGIQPATEPDALPRRASPTPMYFVDVPVGGASTLDIRYVTRAATGLQLNNPAGVSVCRYTGPIGVPQPGSLLSIRSTPGGARLLNAVYRYGAIYAANTSGSIDTNCIVNTNNTTPNAFANVQWYKITPRGASSYTAESHALTDPNIAYFDPSVMPGCTVTPTISGGETDCTVPFVGLEVSGSGPTQSASAFSVQNDGPPVLFQQGMPGFTDLDNTSCGGTNEVCWGDYPGMSADPTDASTVWAMGEYAESSNTWGTAVTYG